MTFVGASDHIDILNITDASKEWLPPEHRPEQIESYFEVELTAKYGVAKERYNFGFEPKRERETGRVVAGVGSRFERGAAACVRSEHRARGGARFVAGKARVGRAIGVARVGRKRGDPHRSRVARCCGGRLSSGPARAASRGPRFIGATYLHQQRPRSSTEG